VSAMQVRALQTWSAGPSHPVLNTHMQRQHSKALAREPGAHTEATARSASHLLSSATLSRCCHSAGRTSALPKGPRLMGKASVCTSPPARRARLPQP